MPRPGCLAVTAALCAGLALPAGAQQLPVGSTVPSAGITGVAQFDADLDGGGKVKMAGVFANASVYHQFTPEFGAGLGVRYDFEDWSFSGLNTPLGREPWSQINRPSLSFPMTWSPSPEWSFGLTPTVQWAYEDGASAGDAVVAGAVVSATRTFSRDLRLGLGVGVYDDLDELKAFPFLVVNWRIDDRWRLANPFRAGPTGGAGLELIYQVNDAWEVAGGGTWRKERFRLNEDGLSPGGIGEWSSIPLFARASWLATRDVRLDFLAGVAVAGKLKLMDPDGNDVAEDDYDPAPFLGITLRTRF